MMDFSWKGAAAEIEEAQFMMKALYGDRYTTNVATSIDMIDKSLDRRATESEFARVILNEYRVREGMDQMKLLAILAERCPSVVQTMKAGQNPFAASEPPNRESGAE